MSDLVFREIGLLNYTKEPQFRFARVISDLRNYPSPSLIPGQMVLELWALNQEGFDTSYLLTDLLINRETTLNAGTAFHILKSLADADKNAAYQCGLCYLGVGKFPQTQSGNLALHYLYLSALKGHKQGFLSVLGGICDNKIQITGKEFVELCRKLVVKTNNLNIAICIGSLSCGYPIPGHPELSKLEVNDPTTGYAFLRYAFNHGDASQKKIAMNFLILGMRRGIFKNECALRFQKILEEKLNTKFNDSNLEQPIGCNMAP